jgi:DNA-binding NtrC family response regulator
VRKLDVRVIATTSRDLAQRVASGSLRADLYCWLNVLPIRLPALRERLSDIEALAEALLDDMARRSGLAAKGLAVDALDRLASRDWPGNIRELRNVLEQSALMTDDRVLTAAHLDGAAASTPAAGLPEAADPSGGPGAIRAAAALK